MRNLNPQNLSAIQYQITQTQSPINDAGLYFEIVQCTVTSCKVPHAHALYVYVQSTSTCTVCLNTRSSAAGIPFDVWLPFHFFNRGSQVPVSDLVIILLTVFISMIISYLVSIPTAMSVSIMYLKIL